jgi:hypothetical protein
VLVVTAATGFAGTAVLLAPATGSASSHREAPYTQSDPEIDNTDLYAFVSPDDADTVTVVANFWPFEEPDGGPNFYRFADDGSAYDIKIDSNGDAQPDLTYRYTFTSTYRTQDTFLYNTGQVTSFDDPDLNFRQFYDLTEIKADGTSTLLLDNAPVAPSNVGPASMPDYPAVRASTLRPVAGGQSFAGQSDDAFFLDLRVFDLLYGGDLSEVGVDTLDGYNVQTLALKLPKNRFALNGDAANNPVIGVWSTTSRPTTRVLPGTDSGAVATVSADLTQVSRLGNPLVNEVVIPYKDKDKFNASRPADDAGSFLSYVQDPEVPRLIESIYMVDAPDTDANTAGTQREDLVEIFLTGVCTGAKGCPSGVAALEADLNSQLLNRDRASTFVASEMLRLNMNVAPTAADKISPLGVIGGDLNGFPNGRRLFDDVVDIELKVLEGAVLGADTTVFNDKVDRNDVPFLGTFPFVAQPHQQAVNRS